jgi:ADP-ribosyl-[dinitrogen reductase] hydrolase
MMTDDQALGMWMGLFIGDAAGVPYEFMPPSTDGSYTFFSEGGVHNAARGEYSDDGAMALAIAEAYIEAGGFDASIIQRNFIDWMSHGTFGTRPNQPAWDVGMTVERALRAVKNVMRPYAGSTAPDTSGNGCIMRLAPCIIWNRDSLSTAIGESVAQALLTHGSSDCITYTAALAHELWEGRPLTQYDQLRNRDIQNTGYVADTYASAWDSILKTTLFDEAISHAINKGGDADTVGSVTGMIAGRIYGHKKPQSQPSLVNQQNVERAGLQLLTNNH